ncbi:MAG: hypothetical protein MJ250_06575 [Alphaproteobacteria bacterium]|nr:hypothetical protein [Alphaproteobacteria bacterium]
MKKLFVFVFLVCFSVGVQAQEVKRLPNCMDFSEVYKRTVINQEDASSADKEEMMSMASLMMGYVSAIQDMYGSLLIGMRESDNEWTLLDQVYRVCTRNPQMTFQRAVRSVPMVADTIQALQDQEFGRCQNYIGQTKTSICYDFCNSKK